MAGKIIDAKVVMNTSISEFNSYLSKTIAEFIARGLTVELGEFNASSPRIGGNTSNKSDFVKYVMVVAREGE